MTSDNVTQLPQRRQQKFKMGIVGFGFVGQAVDYGFSHPEVEKMIVDPKHSSTTLEALAEWNPQVTFLCLPTPSNDDGTIDAAAVDEAVRHLINNSDSFIVIKSTVTPDIVDKLTSIDGRIAYCPEFLTEGNAKMDFITPAFQIFGVNNKEAGDFLQGIYGAFSLCNPCPPIQVSAVEASYLKYMINSFLAMKVSFFNEMYDMVTGYGGSWNQVSRAMMADQRIGYSHTKIPGTDGKRGFGGACFPKDVSAIVKFADSQDIDLSILKTVLESNNKLRSQYELDEREVANNVSYGQTKKEQ
jgi:UDPglucose 6-dehydrogenase